MYSWIPLASGSIKNWGTKVREVKKMGFDSIHLLPITRMGHSQSPYSAADLYEVDPLYAEKEDELEKFVRLAKSLKIRLCFDLVLNHISPDSLMAALIGFNLTRQSVDLGSKRAGCWHMGSWIRWGDLV